MAMLFPCDARTRHRSGSSYHTQKGTAEGSYMEYGTCTLFLSIHDLLFKPEN